jgi:DNA polymerase-3 subunit delta
MRLKPEQIPGHLKSGSILPVYLVCGDEPLQSMECTDLIRRQTRESGADRTVLNVESGFDWNRLMNESSNMGLFAATKLIELRLANQSPGKQGADVLARYCSDNPPDNILLITMDKLDSRMQKTKWFKAIDKAGCIIQVRNIETSRLPAWIRSRLKSLGKNIDRGAAELIAQRTEGNLVATKQELDKLCLLISKDDISLADVQNSITDSSRYDVFAMIEYALKSNGPRVINMLRGLRQEGVEPISIYGAIMWELRRLYSIAARVTEGIPRDRIYNEYNIWYQRQAAINEVLKRYNLQDLNLLLKEAIQIDRALKGAESKDPWQLMESFLFNLGGIKLPC